MVTHIGRHLRLMFADPLRQLQLSLALLLCLVAVGTAGYVVLEGMSWVDALYMTVITLTTVGFGEVKPLSPAGRLFTIVLIMVGVGAAAWAARNVVEVTLGPRLWASISRRKMNEELKRIRNHYIVCGYDRMGHQIVRDLLARGERFVVIERSTEVAEPLLEHHLLHVVGDATQDEVLLQAGVERARGLVAALSRDADNVLAVLTARGSTPTCSLWPVPAVKWPKRSSGAPAPTAW
ncbi:MAG: potassium channel family protein [Ardenticatenia bacterium]|nr:potassium channel family protein [Ardenticatenia bacterium]